MLKVFLERRGLRIHHDNHDDALVKLFDFLKPKLTSLPLTRIGGNGDGGYLVPLDLNEIEVCISPGSNKEWRFEKDLYDRFGIKSAIIDKIENKPIDLYSEFTFTDSWLGTISGNRIKTLESCIEGLKIDLSRDLMLQMDIEGAEYEVLFSMPETLLKRFRILIIEFHYSERFKNRELFEAYFAKVFDRLNAYFEVLHFHPNNCCGVWEYREHSLPSVFELTLVRRDRIDGVLGFSEIPHVLDSDCVSDLPTVAFKFK
jgi:hypothetical protein